MRSDAFIPESVEDLSPDWLTRELSRAGFLEDARVKARKVTILGEGEGFLGVIARLALEFEGDPKQCPRSLVAKLPLAANRAMGEMLGVYEREVLFYQDLASSVPVRTPKLYFGALDRDRGSENQEAIMRAFERIPSWLAAPAYLAGMWIARRKKRRYLVLMEDLAGCRSGDQLEGASVDDCRLVLEHTARVHAAFWQSEKLHGHFWLLPQTIDVGSRNRLFQNSREDFLARFAHLELAALPTIADFIVAHGRELGRVLHENAPETINHCDLRLDNVFFVDGAPPDVVLFDWQLVRRGAAAYDVAYFVSSALPVEVGADGEESLLRAYYRELVAGGVSQYPFERFVEDYHRALVITLQNFGTIDQVEMGQDRGRHLMDAWISRAVARLEGIDLRALL